jgi:hypothetical protein
MARRSNKSIAKILIPLTDDSLLDGKDNNDSPLRILERKISLGHSNR